MITRTRCLGALLGAALAGTVFEGEMLVLLGPGWTTADCGTG